jgi:Ca2+/Na+ antiporter
MANEVKKSSEPIIKPPTMPITNSSNPPKTYVQYAEPVITELNLRNPYHATWAFAIGMIFTILFILALFHFNFELYQAFGMFALMIIIYAIILFFLLSSKKIREIRHYAVKTVEKPVVRQVIVEKEVPKEVIVEKPVYKEVVKKVEVEKPVYLEKPRKKLEIKKYNFVGSSEEKTYHKRNCRFSKLIKRKYKVSNDSEEYFKRRGYHACKACIKPKKKTSKKSK